tara:strand:+ start:6574 stop:7446 length:873 start_codon:yes stop_codon:yes gene_type:complete
MHLGCLKIPEQDKTFYIKMSNKKEDKMQKEFLKDVIVYIAGKQAEDLVSYMDDKKYINEFLIAKKLGITINQLRNILYKLSDEGIVSSVRKKDKRKGWYTYFWKIEVLRSLYFLKEIFDKRIDQVLRQIESRQKKNFYICEGCKIELSEENALLQDFTCTECGDVFVMKDNARLLKELSKNFDKQKKRLDIIKEEINNEKENLEKKKLREIKKEKDAKKKKLSIAKKKKVKKTKTVKKIAKKIKKKVVKKKVKSLAASSKRNKNKSKKKIKTNKKSKIKKTKKSMKRKKK